MRYPPEHKQANRRQLVAAGSALAKQSGFAATGVDALAASAGMTSGAFYSQFSSKHDLLQAIVEHELSRVVKNFSDTSPDHMLAALSFYLSPYHAEHPEKGCAVPALGAEIARANLATREAFEERMLQLKARFSELLQDDQAAWAMISQAIGALVVARAMATPERRDEVLNAVLAQARQVIAAAPALYMRPV